MDEANPGTPAVSPSPGGGPDPQAAPAPAASPSPAAAGGVETNKDACTWGMLCHLTTLSGFVGIPFGHILGPLIVWLMKKQEFPFVDAQGKEALNFQISMMIYIIVAILLCFVLIGFLVLPVLLLVDLICVIIASVKANGGESYRYPITIRFLK
jgi:uncharacterized Tic20 family protein